jgi:hypothetical protein
MELTKMRCGFFHFSSVFQDVAQALSLPRRHF